MVSEQQYQSELAVQRQMSCAGASGQHVFDWQSLITLPELELLIMGQRTMKATGHDGVSAEYLRLCSPDSAGRLLPLLTKTTLSLSEPVAFKGGSLLTLAKRAGAATQCSDFRSILVECAPAKLYHKALRNRLVPALLRNGRSCSAVPRQAQVSRRWPSWPAPFRTGPLPRVCTGACSSTTFELPFIGWSGNLWCQCLRQTSRSAGL